MINYIWIDSETTGLDPVKNDVVQIACVPVIGGVQPESSFNEHCQPIDWEHIDAKALEVNKLTLTQLKTFQSSYKMVEHLVDYLSSFNTKFTIAGYNVDFDRNFISSLFKKVGRENDFVRLFNSDTRDVYKRAKLLKSEIPTTNLKLLTLCNHYSIHIDAHDALSDILATIKLDKILSEKLGDVERHETIVHKIIDNLHFNEPAQLHCHSMYSYTDSVPSIKELSDWCLANNVPGFSVVDHGNAASTFDIAKISNDKVTGIPGCGLHIDMNGQRFFLNAWAQSDIGYKNLLKLSSIGWLNKVNISDIDFPLISIEEVIKLKDGIVFGVPGINGPLTNLILNKKIESIPTTITYLNSNLDLRLELAAIDVIRYFDSSIGFRSYAVNGGNIQKIINNFYYILGQKYNIKCVPVSDCHFIEESDKVIQDCLSRNSYKDSRFFFESRKIIKANDMFTVLKSHIAQLTEDQFTSMIDNTVMISNAASSIKIKKEYHLPCIDIPEHIRLKTTDYNEQTFELTMDLIKRHGRWNDSPEYVERFNKEIDVVMKNATLNFLPYFLVYENICEFVRSCGLLQNLARGSAGGSLLSYYLKIIHIDPVVNDLPFERFLSHARIRAGSFPDIDLDIADNARPLVMKYLQEKYKLGFAQIATFNKMKTKNAIKDAMWALYGRNRNDPEIRAVCDSIPDSPQGVDEFDFLYGYIDQEGEEHKGQVQVNELLRNFFFNKPEIENIIKRLIGCIRGWSRHASAFVISTIDLASDRVPTMIMDDKDLGTILVTQYDASMVEKSGLVKADILGIRTLSTVSECVKMIEKNHGINLMEEEKGVPLIYRLPDNDKGVFSDFYKKDTDSSFQFNTELIKGYAQEFCPLSKADLSTMTALCRPGSLDAPWGDSTAAQYYLDVRNGKKDIEYLHIDLAPILKKTNGVLVYQEQLLEFLVTIAGYSWEESDIIRSAIAKKKHEVIMATFERIRTSCLNRGWSQDAANTICQQIQAFSNYSFNLSHSRAYSELGYITLYLKHHYKLEWWCSVLNNENTDEKLRKYISYLGDTVAPPSLKNPSQQFAIRGDKIIAPISAIKGIGPAVVNEIVSKGPFISLEDYVTRVNHSRCNVGSMSAIIKARAADDLMDMSLTTYKEKRIDFLNKYCALRNNKTSFKAEMFDLDDIKIFLEEKELNQTFNKNFLTYPGISTLIEGKWSGLKPTGNDSIPYIIGGSPVLAGVKVGEKLLQKQHSEEIGMILLFDSSEYKQGISKKGKKWSKVGAILSDGFNEIECIDWNGKKALGWPKNTIVYVRGTLKEGWKTSVCLNLSQKIEKVE